MRCLVAMLTMLAVLSDLASADMFPGEDLIPRLPLGVPLSKDARCKADSLALIANLDNSTTWAMRMWDSSAKGGGVGLVTGNTYQLGDFDECLSQVRPVRAQYCLATLHLSQRNLGDHALDETKLGSVWENIIHDGDPSKIPRDVISWALCVPASCTQSDIEASLNQHLAATLRNSSRAVKVQFDSGACQTDRQEERMSPGSIAYCVVLVLIMIVVMGSTITDFCCTDNDLEKRSNVIGYLLCFSLRKNLPEMARADSPDRRLNCIYGLRVLSILLIVVSHRFAHTVAGPVQNFELVERQYSQFYAALFVKSDMLVDNFFVIGALLGTYVLCMTLEKKKANPLMVIIIRYVRLTPVYAIVVFFYASLMYHLGGGPLWARAVGIETRACAKNWWTNLLYINNYVNDDEMCMVVGWFLPCDMHYFIVAVFLVPLIYKRPKIGLSVLGVLTFLSALVPFVITFLGQKEPVLYYYQKFFVTPRADANFQSMYTKSHNRAGTYLVGMATGYFLYRTRSSKKTTSWRTSAGMAVSILVCCAAVLPATIFYDPRWKYDAFQAALYAGVHRIAWGVGVAGLIVSIVFTENSLIGAFLSWPPMIWLSKLSYCQFLVHMALQVVHLASLRTPEHISFLRIGSLALGDICWSLLIALVLYLSVEAPLRLVCKRIITPRKQRVQDTNLS